MNKTAKKHRNKAIEKTFSNTDGSILSRFARATMHGCIAAVATGAILSLVCALIAYACADPDAVLPPLALGVIALCALAAGLFSWRKARSSPLLCGALSGLSLMLLAFFFSCFLPDTLRGTIPASMSWGLRGGMLVFCVLGAIMAANMPRGNKVKRKRRSR
ncbi:MAG: TIGR04086 family membrane protein [Clostridia bacterium]|nr:TIGR04086 family membrane protein [Clostridia bacterium]